MTIKVASSRMALALSAGLIFFRQPIVLAESNQEQLNLGQILPISATANLAGQTFNLEVAQTPEQQEIGLMNRTFLPDNQGMLFPFGSPQPVAFWMRNTLIPLDIIFLSQATVVEIAQNLPPCLTDYCPFYSPAVDISQGTDNLDIDDVFLFQSKPVDINYEGFELPKNIVLLGIDQVIEVKGGRTSEVGLRKGRQVAVRRVLEPSSYIGILAFAAFSAFLRMKCK